jgi:hypothetical protein
VLYEWLLSENLFVFRWKIQNGRHCWAVFPSLKTK